MKLPGMRHGSTLRFLFLLCCLTLLAGPDLVAQAPGRVAVKQAGKDWRPTGVKMTCNDAGNVDFFTNFALQSNSFGNPAPNARIDYNARPDTIFLCAGDRFSVDMDNGTVDLDGDPISNPGSEPGVGFAFYRCQPTVTGPTIQDLINDPCILTGGAAGSGFDTIAIGVPSNYENEDYEYIIDNDGFSIQAAFSAGGDPQPVVFNITPITFDSAALNPATGVFDPFYESATAGAPVGQCVDVSVDQDFVVAFLTPVEIDQPNLNPASCDGFFAVRGGVPQLRGGTGYTVSIVHQTTGAEGIVTTQPGDVVHNGLVNYTVPEAGVYDITITDDLGCTSAVVSVDHPMGCPLPVVLNLPIDAILEGGSGCYDITVENFTDIVGIQFGLSFDPAVLQFDGIANVNPALGGNIAVNGPPNTGGTQPDGQVVFVYDDLTITPVDLANGDVFFSLCFTVVGDFGDQSPLVVSDPSMAEFTRTPDVPGDMIVNPGVLVVTDQAFLLTLDKDNEVCSGFNNGKITATANGAPAPFTFSIATLGSAVFTDARTVDGNPATTTFVGLEDDEYVVRAVSANGETVLDTIEVEAGISVAANVVDVREPSCFGESDGLVAARVLGVSDPLGEGYTFAWEGFAETTDTLRNVPAGVYSVTVTAPNGVCTTFDSGNLGEPTEVRVRPDAPEDAVSMATCSGSPDGGIEINADGGTGPYTFAWSDGLGTDTGVSTASRDNLVPGEYEVTVTDALGCTDVANFVVDAAKTLLINATTANVQCFADADGRIEVNGSFSSNGGAAVLPYFVTLINNATGVAGPEQQIVDNSVPFVFADLDAGEYTVLLRDSDPVGCETTRTFTITQPDELVISDDPTITNETCTTGNDGSIAVDVSGGTRPYEYRFVNAELDMPLDTITPDSTLGGLSADTAYLLVVTDANGCTDSLEFRINAPAGATLSPIDTSFISCPGDADGQLTVAATPPAGETIISVTWSRLNDDNTIGPPVATGLTTQNNLGIGRYVVEVVTSNSCTASAVGVVVSPGRVFLDGFDVIDPTCPGDANGSITLFVAGGTPNDDNTYNYVWSTDPNGAPTNNNIFGPLTAGTYSVTVTDANGCEPPFDTTFVLIDPPAIVANFMTTDVSCPDDQTADGTSTVTASYDDGTQGLYDFLWPASGTADFGTTSSTETLLSRGRANVRITDGVCTLDTFTIVGSPEEFDVELSTTAVSCFGLADGAATVAVSGGTPGYTFAWTNAPDTDNTVTGLAAGTGFRVAVTDANGCMPDTLTFNITEPDPLTLSLDPVQTTPTVRCAGDQNGRIGVFVSSVNNNPLADNPYSWSGNVAGSDESLAQDLGPGVYSVTVTDTEGCQDSLSYTIGEPEAITFTVLPIEEPLCFGETTPVLIDTAFGGTSAGIGDFTFSVNNDGFRIPVGQTGTAFAGEILVTVFDSIGCTAEQTFSVNQPPEILIDLPEEIVVELGDSLTRLNPLISPAGDVYTYRWTPADYLESDTIRSPLIFPFESLEYTFTATNANGCQAFADIFVEVDANRNVYIPNAFSPNRDGRNEEFRMFACQGVRSVNRVQVYDRWGGLLFDRTGFEPNCLDGIELWDGNGQNGKPVTPGVFVYVIEVEFLDNVKLLYRGDIAVLR